ncbi:MAG: polysaccharide biosynthesis/export family protein [Chitinophagaceae bacterium]|nr:polysaccharide biosynthesis/export family protein [Chitinophagaceae bacterium]
MSKKIPFFLLFAAVMILCNACNSTKKLIYFEDLQNVRETALTSNVQDNAEHKIENNEVLSIRVTSPTTEEAAYRIFNINNDYRSSAPSSAGPRAESTGYLVSSEGYIEIPLLGPIKASGLTKTQLKDYITKKILDKKLLIEPIVEIRFLNYEVTILGEVARPTVINVPTEKISLIKALGVAGDITTYGRRDNVMIVRESEGKKIVTRVNLNSSSFLQSPYYYLQPNDVVYVETTKNRAASVDRTRLILPSILSTISVAILVIDRITRN